MLEDEFIAVQLDLLRLEAGARNVAFRTLTQLEQELTKLLRQGELTRFGRDRVKRLLAQAAEVVRGYYARIEANMGGVLAGAAQAQAKAAQAALTSVLATVDLGVNLPTTGVMRALTSDLLVFGAKSSEWWRRQAGDLSFRFATAVRQGITAGETTEDIVRRVIEFMHGPARANVRSLIHASVMAAAAEARRETYRANDDVIKGTKQISTLDSRTTEICVAYDGAQYNLDGKPIRGTKLPYNNGVPRHWGCRSVEVPITKSFKELGVDLDEPRGGTRASEDGPVPASLTFADFLERQGKKFQDEVLGSGRAELWRRGKLTLPQLLDLRGNPLSVKQLERRYA